MSQDHAVAASSTSMMCTDEIRERAMSDSDHSNDSDNDEVEDTTFSQVQNSKSPGQRVSISKLRIEESTHGGILNEIDELVKGHNKKKGNVSYILAERIRDKNVPIHGYKTVVYTGETSTSVPLMLEFGMSQKKDYHVNILVFYYKPGHVYAITTRNAYTVVQRKCDYDFPLNVARRIVNPEKVRIEDVLCLVGKSKQLSKVQKHAMRTSTLLTEFVVRFTAELENDCCMYHLACFRNEENIIPMNVEIKLSSIRFQHPFHRNDLPEILHFISGTLSNDQISQWNRPPTISDVIGAFRENPDINRNLPPAKPQSYVINQIRKLKMLWISPQSKKETSAGILQYIEGQMYQETDSLSYWRIMGKWYKVADNFFARLREKLIDFLQLHTLDTKDNQNLYLEWPSQEEIRRRKSIKQNAVIPKVSNSDLVTTKRGATEDANMVPTKIQKQKSIKPVASNPQPSTSTASTLSRGTTKVDFNSTKEPQVSTPEPLESQITKNERDETEGEYNKLYNVLPNYFVGDKHLTKYIELADILRYDEENNSIYVYHVKAGFDSSTREVSSQIRNSTDIWYEVVNHNATQLDFFPSLHKIMLKRKEDAINEHNAINSVKIENSTLPYKKLFSSKIIFVFGMAPGTGCNVWDETLFKKHHINHSNLLTILEEDKKQKWTTIKKILKLAHNDDGAHLIIAELKKNEYIDDSHLVLDKLIYASEKTFKFNGLNFLSQKKIFLDLLTPYRTRGNASLLPILEVLHTKQHLDNLGYDFKVCQIPVQI